MKAILALLKQGFYKDFCNVVKNLMALVQSQNTFWREKTGGAADVTFGGKNTLHLGSTLARHWRDVKRLYSQAHSLFFAHACK